MAKGAKQKSNIVHLATGSKHARPLEPKYKTPVGKPPEILSGVGLETWEKIAAEMTIAGTISNVDAEALLAYCTAVQDLYDTYEDIETHGRIVETERGLVKNPAFTIRATALTQIKAFACEFGLTPASRGKVQGTPEPKKNRFEGFSAR